MADSSAQPNDEVTRFALPKLDGVPLSSLLDSSNPSLVSAVRRVMEEAKERTANFAAFGNAP